MITTTTTADLLNSWFPWTKAPLLVIPPMRTISTPALTAATTTAGTLSFLALGYDLASPTHSPTIAATIALLPTTLPVAVPNTAPIGLGFLLFSAPLSIALDLVLLHRPSAVWLFGAASSAQTREWAHAIKAAAPWTRIMAQVSTVAEAVALADVVDALVVQGTADAGGHGIVGGASIVALVPEVRDRVGSAVPVFAAGGVADGRGVAAALALGADGVVVGTRMVATEESAAPAGFKALLVATGDGGKNTVRTRVYDELRGTATHWPPQFGGRAIVNDSLRDHEMGIDEDVNRARYRAAEEEEDFKRLTAFAGLSLRLHSRPFHLTSPGTSVGLIHSIPPAATLVLKLRSDAVAILSQLAVTYSHSIPNLDPKVK